MPTTHQLVTLLFLQLSVLLIVCRATGWLFRRMGQTQVVSEMIAGVLLGPSFLGIVAPKLQSFLFPKQLILESTNEIIPHPSMMLLLGLSQLGLVLYMFMIGLEFNTKLLSKHWRSAGAISLAGVIAPMVLGGGLGFIVVQQSGLFTDIVSGWQAALFMGAAMLITAFPMLARIIYESGISKTKIGTLVIGAAAFDDAIAWVILAVVIASAQNSPGIAALTIGGGILYLGVMWGIGKPLFRKLFTKVPGAERDLPPIPFMAVLLTVMLCAWFTDWVGIYSIFGAFIAGTMMPRSPFMRSVRRFIEPITVTILLPIFFVYSGLNTQLNLLVQPQYLGVTLAVLLVAFLTKGGACLLGSRLGGMSWREAGLIGALMNARGLMELLLANIGRENGLISPTLFSMLILMTLCTTASTSPIFNALARQTVSTLPKVSPLRAEQAEKVEQKVS